MSCANNSDGEDKPSSEAIERLFQSSPEPNSNEAFDKNCEVSEDVLAPPGFDTSKLKGENAGHKIVEQELDFEEEVHDEKEDSPQKDVEPEEDVGSGGEAVDDREEGEADEGEVTDEDDLEEGEVKDGSSNRKMQPRPICRFFNKGQCTWGTSCRFIHPGVNDKGNYNMFAPNKIPFGSSMMPPGPPPPMMMMMMMMMGPGHYGPRMGMRGPEVPLPPTEETQPVESAWERGLRHAKEILKKASRRKEQEPDFEEKRMNLSIESGEKGVPDYDKENDYYGRSPPNRHTESFGYGKYEEPPEPFESSDRESREVWRSGRYENFEVRWPRHEFESRDRAEKERSRYRRSYDREKYEHRNQDDERLREDIPTRGDEWRDPWRRSKTPKGRSHSRGHSRRSYSSASSRSFSSRSSRSSYSYSRSSSSKSSYYSSDSYSKSRSRSPFSRLDSPSPPTRPRNYDRTRQEPPTRRRRVPFPPSRSPTRAGRSPPLRVPRSPPGRLPRSPMPPRTHLSPVRVIRQKLASPDATKQIPLPPVPVPTSQPPLSQPLPKEIIPEVATDARSKGETRNQLPRNYSGSESSRSRSRSASSLWKDVKSSSSASRSRSRSVSRSRSFSRSISMSSVSSASGSDSSSESDFKKSRRSPPIKELPTRTIKNITEPTRKYEDKVEHKPVPKVVVDLTNQGAETERGKGLSAEVVAPVAREKRISMVLPKQLHAHAIQSGQQVIVPVTKVSKDLLRQSGQKPIKLTLLSKAPPPPSALEKSPSQKDVVKSKPVEREEPKKEIVAMHGRKRPLSPTLTKPIIGAAAVSVPATTVAATAASSKRSTTSRREELLKQLKAVEDAIARKRAKII